MPSFFTKWFSQVRGEANLIARKTLNIEATGNLSEIENFCSGHLSDSFGGHLSDGF
jgi:hypothetical protein